MKRWTWKSAVWILLYVGMITTIVLVLLRVQDQVKNGTLDPKRATALGPMGRNGQGARQTVRDPFSVVYHSPKILLSVY